MKIVSINSLPNGSTGRIMCEIADMSRKDGFDAYCYWGSWYFEIKEINVKYGRFGSSIENKISAVFSILTGLQNFGSIIGTISLIKKIKKINPDIIHLHNLHLWTINLPMLFKYIKKHNIKTVWTLHDCWAFTGHCPYFDIVGCNKWETGCYGCPQYKEYPKSLFDNSKIMYRLKRKWFTGVENMTIVTPSEWLASLVKESYLKDYPVKVINNGIDLNVFKPTESDFREKYALENKYIVLGVAFGWGRRKGLDVFVELARRLDKEKYKVVLVGTDDNVDKLLPENIISIHRTQNQTELAKIYSAADVFANPTREENYPTVNMEALACGTPVVTFNTGGSPEMLDETCGAAVAKNDIDAMYNEIIRICEKKPYSLEACIKKAKGFDKNEKFGEYIRLYEVLNEQKQSC